MTVTLADIHAARARIRDAIYHSPCPYSLSLSRLCGVRVHCKLDHLQMTGSFKERGARNKLLGLTPAVRSGGVVAASAGNHALGLAYHGQLLGVPVTVVMPKWAPLVKVANCRAFAAEVILHGEAYDEARTHALALARARGATYVPGFDDDDIIAGAGTLGLEIIEDVPRCDAVLVPVGGGGLIAGVAVAIKALRPHVRIIGVEAESAPTLQRSLANGTVTRVDTRATLADGLAVAEIGARCFAIARELVDEVVLVDEGDIATAVLRMLELEKTLVEGAGAVPLAALLAHRTGLATRLAGQEVVLLVGGGNIDVTLIARIIERGLAADGRLCRFGVLLSDRPGSLARLLTVVAEQGASVKEVDHDRHFGPADVARIAVILVLETRDHAHVAEVRAAIAAAGYELAPASG